MKAWTYAHFENAIGLFQESRGKMIYLPPHVDVTDQTKGSEKKENKNFFKYYVDKSLPNVLYCRVIKNLGWQSLVFLFVSFSNIFNR